MEFKNNTRRNTERDLTFCVVTHIVGNRYALSGFVCISIPYQNSFARKHKLLLKSTEKRRLSRPMATSVLFGLSRRGSFQIDYGSLNSGSRMVFLKGPRASTSCKAKAHFTNQIRNPTKLLSLQLLSCFRLVKMSLSFFLLFLL